MTLKYKILENYLSDTLILIHLYYSYYYQTTYTSAVQTFILKALTESPLAKPGNERYYKLF